MVTHLCIHFSGRQGIVTMRNGSVLLCEIPPGGTASKLHTGSGLRKDGPLLALP
jgi:hypothetical protein